MSPEPGDVHVRWLELDLPAERVAALRATLSDDERRRADRFLIPGVGARFTAGRGQLRAVLARYLGARPEELRFAYGPQGKPSLGGTELRFNLSHSAARGVLAVTRGAELGIDVERVRPEVEYEGLARRFFSPGEAEALRTVAPELRAAAFFAAWTRKEAFIKAKGGGLSIPLDRFQVTLRPGENAALLCTEWDPAEAGRYCLEALSDAAGPGWAAALALETPATAVRVQVVV